MYHPRPTAAPLPLRSWSLLQRIRKRSAMSRMRSRTRTRQASRISVIPGDVITVSQDSKEVKVGETVTVESPRGTFDLTIDSIRLTDERSAGIRADRVVEVTYTYANTHNYADLLIGDTCFMLSDSQGRACAPYIFDPTSGDHPQPMPIGQGEQFTSSFGFILPEDSDASVTLLYKASFEDPDSFEFNVKADL